MYCEFYGFREKPFNITPNPHFLFLSKNHREAFAHLLYGIDNHSGFIKLTGEVGTGKTTVLRTLFDQLDVRGHRTALIFNPCLTAEELMRSINRELSIPWKGLSITELLDDLNHFLLAENAAGRTVVLVIDEAQNLEPKVLEQIRLISNLETKTDKLIQIILAGQPELGDLLGRSELRQLSQRITVSYHLTPMDFEDTQAYIQHRLEVAGDLRAAVFTRGALKRVFRFSGGVPRLINILCDRALLFGYVAESRVISVRMVKEAITEIRRENRGSAAPPLRKAVFGCLALLVGGSIFFLLRSAPGILTLPRTEQRAPAKAKTAPVRIPPTLQGELSHIPESESSLKALNAVLQLWDAAPLSEPIALSSRDLEKEAAVRGLNLVRYNGTFDFLVRMNYPAILEFIVPGTEGKRYLALTGVDHGKFLLSPSFRERNSFVRDEVKSIWSGNAFLFWKNFRNVPVATTALGAQGQEIVLLQELLRDAHVYSGEITGIFGSKTLAAVRKFQDETGLMRDGLVGDQTLLMLYQAGGRFPIPGLIRPGGTAQK
jgi:general secretion pathway protein A